MVDGARPSRPPALRASLLAPREPAFWSFLVLLLLAGLVTVLEQGVLFASSPQGFTLSWALLLLYLLPMFALIWLLDVYDREPLSLVLGALAWGAIGATSLSAVANDAWGGVIARLAGPDFAANWSAAITAPIVEESLKAVGVVLIYLIARDELNDVMDGFVYGAMVGLGFAVVEDVYYFVAKFGGEVGGVLAGFFMRVIAGGLYGHVLYTGLTGMGIAYFVTRRGEVGRARRWLTAGALFGVGAAAHFIWNSPLLNVLPKGDVAPLALLALIPLAMAVKGLPFLAFLVLMLRMAHAREVHWLRTGIEAELGGPGLRDGELAVLLSGRARRRARQAAARRGGPRAAALLKRLHREQIRLAMIRSKVTGDDHPDLVRQRAVCQAAREDLAAALGERGGWPPDGPRGGTVGTAT
jgi:RsiW-degrading membrane proteinase PrsW (M82 family)